MGNIGPQQLLIVAVIFIVLFGAKKLPETAKGLAQSLRVFKKELRPEEEEAARNTEQDGQVAASEQTAQVTAGEAAAEQQTGTSVTATETAAADESPTKSG